MTKNIEIEFKTFISEDVYNNLIKEFELENNIFSQTNYYFDTEDTILMQEKTVLRISESTVRFRRSWAASFIMR